MGTEIQLPAEAAGTAPGRGRLMGRRVLVVGAGTRPSGDPEAPPGNGRAIAVLAAREGAAVACADLGGDVAQATVDWIRREGHHAVPLVANVTDAAACERVVADAAEQLGGLDGVVCNVGIAAGIDLEGTSPEVWDEVFAVNLRAHFLVARAALPRMPAGGALVFVSSTAALRPSTRIPTYTTSKAGLSGLCRHVALEGAPRGIRANIVMPGYIDTPLGRLAAGIRPELEGLPPLQGRAGTAWEVAYAVVFLLSNEASYITAQELVVDGALIYQAE